MTGRFPFPQPWSSGICPPQPPSATQASHCVKVISNLLSANGALMVTRCCISAPRYDSDVGEPIMNSPAGMETISGQSVQSLNTALVRLVDGPHAASRHAAVASATVAPVVGMRRFIVRPSEVSFIRNSNVMYRVTEYAHDWRDDKNDHVAINCAL